APRSFLAHVSPESHVVCQQHLESALASGKMKTCELSVRNTAGHETFVRIQSVVSHSEKEQKDFYVTLTDLTERREIEQKLELQKALAEAAVTSKELFLECFRTSCATPSRPWSRFSKISRRNRDVRQKIGPRSQSCVAILIWR